MAKTKGYEDKRGALAALLKKEPEHTPLQEVRPVAQKSADEVRVNFNVPPEFAKRLKMHAAESGKTIKEIMMESYEFYTQMSK